jgi:hypothetical protein
MLLGSGSVCQNIAIINIILPKNYYAYFQRALLFRLNRKHLLSKAHMPLYMTLNNHWRFSINCSASYSIVQVLQSSTMLVSNSARNASSMLCCPTRKNDAQKLVFRQADAIHWKFEITKWPWSRKNINMTWWIKINIDQRTLFPDLLPERKKNVKREAPKAVNIKIGVSWSVTPCSLVDICQLLWKNAFSTSKTETTDSSKQ